MKNRIYHIPDHGTYNVNIFNITLIISRFINSVCIIETMTLDADTKKLFSAVKNAIALRSSTHFITPQLR